MPLPSSDFGRPLIGAGAGKLTRKDYASYDLFRCIRNAIIVDFAWAKYIGSVKDGAAMKAAGWAGFLYGMQGFATISIVGNNMALIPAILGAALGTYCGVKTAKA